MVAQRKPTRTTSRRRTAVMQPQQAARDPSDDDDSAARELLALQAMRFDARAWLADIEQRIKQLQA